MNCVRKNAEPWTLQHLYAWLPLGFERSTFVCEMLRRQYINCASFCVFLCELRIYFNMWSVFGSGNRSLGSYHGGDASIPVDFVWICHVLSVAGTGFLLGTSDLPYLDHPAFAMYSYFIYINLKPTLHGLCKWRGTLNERFVAKYYLETNILIS